MSIATPIRKTCQHSPCVDAERCQACLDCTPLDICPARAFERLADSRRPVVVHLDGCYGCRACVTACPFEAILWV